MASQLSPDVIKQIETGFSHLLANKYYVLASTVMLVYDHMLTFDREREHIWNRPKNIPTYLFFIFRYTTPIVSLINLIALNDPTWTGPTCNNWIWLPVAMGPIISAATGVILILRVYAIYRSSKWILILTVPVYLAELAVMGWSIPAGSPASLPPGFIGCVPSEKPGTGRRLSALYAAALAFDATIFLLTFARAIYMRFTKSTIPLAQLIIRDGTLYFLVIFIVNLVNVCLLTLAPADLSAINAPFASMITAVLVARLMINLREAGKQTVVNSQRVSTSTKVLSTWRPAVRSGTDETDTTSDGVVSFRPYGDHLGIGTMSFKEMIGFEEFNVALGGDGEDDGSWYHSQSNFNSTGEGEGSSSETYEMGDTTPPTSAHHEGV